MESAMVVKLAQMFTALWEIAVSYAFIFGAALIHAGIKYREHRTKSEVMGWLDYVWITATAVFSGLVVAEGVAVWTGSTAYGGVAGAIGGLMGIEVVDKFGKFILDILERRGKPRKGDDD